MADYERELAALRATHHTVDTLRAALDALAAAGHGGAVVSVWWDDSDDGTAEQRREIPRARGDVAADEHNPGFALVALTDVP